MGDLGLLSFQIGGDIAEYTKSMNAAKQQAQELQSMLQNKAKDISMNINTDSFNAAAQASQRMGETMSQSMRGAGESVKNLQRTLKQLEELYDRLPNKESTSGKSLLDNINKLKSRDILYIAREG